MRRMSVAVAAMVLGITVLVPLPASADTRGCVTRTEFQRASVGMKQTRVHGIFDTKGHGGVIYTDPSTGTKKETRWYAKCTDGITLRTADVRYVKRTNGQWRVAGKRW